MKPAIKYLVSHQVTATALSLALTLMITGPGLAHAESGSLWNPVNWFTPSVAPVDASKAAELKAETARKEAELAEKIAKHAQERAEEARRKAEAAETQKNKLLGSQVKTQDEEKPAQPVVKAPEIENAPAAANAETDTAKKADDSNPKSGGWHMLNLFDKTEPAKTEAVQSEAKSASNNLGQPEGLVDQALKSQAALIETEKGNIAIELYPDEAPKTVANFVKLANSGFYNKFNMKFHRVVPGFVIQTGDPTGTGAGGSRETIPLEAKNKLSHNAKGVVAMARGQDPNSATSQFYITLAPQTSLDGKYAIFGRVISGLSVLDKIEMGDMLYGVRMVDMNTVTRDVPEKKGLFSTLF